MRNKIFTITCSLQIASLSTVIYSVIGINVTLLREIIGFLHLIFVPGILLLIMFSVKSLNFSELIFYSVDLSISFLIYIELSNTLYPLVGTSSQFH